MSCVKSEGFQRSHGRACFFFSGVLSRSSAGWLASVRADMLQLYLECCKDFGWQKDEALVSAMEERIATEIAKLDEK